MIDLNAFKLNAFKILAQVTANQMIKEATNSSWRDLPDKPRPLPDRPRTADQVRSRTIEAIAWRLGAGAKCVPPGRDAHHTLAVEISPRAVDPLARGRARRTPGRRRPPAPAGPVDPLPRPILAGPSPIRQ
ncbi:hypothetical protein ACFCYC_29100 [Streptomyces sp. NPDC056402]|uniref:hypothetical protein n=1 Tax=Streptomyces sp. NPDC056402 TaxID=3345810 RepID=UPI0035DA309A